LRQLKDELEMLDGAGAELNREAILSGAITPVFFGSAMTNFGVEPFLEAFSRIFRRARRARKQPRRDSARLHRIQRFRF
jgi:peptide chain release factor 3